MGRTRGASGDRVIDLDLLVFEGVTISGEFLKVPHPRLHERGFVLVPLCELSPELKHPLLKKTVRELLREVSCEEVRGRVIQASSLFNS